MGLVACAGHGQKKNTRTLSREKIPSKFSVNYSIQILPVVLRSYLEIQFDDDDFCCAKRILREVI